MHLAILSIDTLANIRQFGLMRPNGFYFQK